MKKSTIKWAMAPIAFGTGAIIGRFASKLTNEDDSTAAKLAITLGGQGLCIMASYNLIYAIDRLLDDLEALGVNLE